MTKEVYLNLGCGKRPIFKKGWENYDINTWRIFRHVKKIDLDVQPYPFKNNYANYIKMCHVLEHLRNTLDVFKECYRVLKPLGIFEVTVPLYPHKPAFTNPDHKSYFTKDTANMIVNTNFALYFMEDKKFKLIDTVYMRMGFPFKNIRNKYGLNIPFFPNMVMWKFQK